MGRRARNRPRRGGGAEQKIRKYLIDNNYVDAVIQLPPDLFFGTTIATCIVVLKKSKADNKTLFFIESRSGTILKTEMPVPGRPLYSHEA